jgi:hypothetical protein
VRPLTPSRLSQAAKLQAFIRELPDSNLFCRRLNLARVSCGFVGRLEENAATVTQGRSRPLPATFVHTSYPAIRRCRGGDVMCVGK